MLGAARYRGRAWRYRKRKQVVLVDVRLGQHDRKHIRQWQRRWCRIEQHRQRRLGLGCVERLGRRRFVVEQVEEFCAKLCRDGSRAWQPGAPVNVVRAVS